jgi:hypothetical protein
VLEVSRQLPERCRMLGSWRFHGPSYGRITGACPRLILSKIRSLRVIRSVIKTLRKYIPRRSLIDLASAGEYQRSLVQSLVSFPELARRNEIDLDLQFVVPYTLL